MAVYERLGHLPLEIDSIALDRREAETVSGFTRTTTVVTLTGDGHRGQGEDVIYDESTHHELQSRGIDLPLDTVSTFDEFSRSLESVELVSDDEVPPIFENYRRWALESAALDLALRQRGLSLAEAIDRPYRPVRFVTSPSLGDPPSADRVHQLLDLTDGLEFKLDPDAAWDDELLLELAETAAVAILDFKGLYEDLDAGLRPDQTTYERVLSAFPDAIIEDPSITQETSAVLEPARQRIAWDYPIRGVGDIDTRPWPPRWLNIKPSRFGSVRSLLTTIEPAVDRGIALYGGGQFELDVGREHLHTIASLFYPDGPNDVAPREFNLVSEPSELSSSPLEPPDEPVGLSWR